MVKEINRKIKYTVVPGAPDFIVGLFNMRGQIVTVFDLARRIHGKPGDISLNPTCIILKNEDNSIEHLGFVVDRPGDVIDVEEEWCEPMPGNIQHIDGQYIKEVIKLEDQLIMLIDPEKIFDYL